MVKVPSEFKFDGFFAGLTQGPDIFLVLGWGDKLIFAGEILYHSRTSYLAIF